jgi:ABC-type multidrug transport system fused ATPase/permease subunit
MFENFAKKISQEPVVFMIGRMWRFSEDLKPRIVLMWLLSVMGHLIWMLPPFIIGLILNEIQINSVTSENIQYILLLFTSIFIVGNVGWTFHGPSRVMERSIGYKVDRYYKKYLYHAVLSLPLTWHADHDSGDTIDKVDKATQSIFQFSRSTFVIVRTIVRIVATTAVLVYFDWHVAAFAFLMLCLAILVLLNFDKKLIPQYKEINIFDNKASAKVYDAMSNVTTVKVLHIEESVLKAVKDSWWASYSVYMKNKILVEWKWFSGSLVIDFLVIFPIIVYIYYNYSIGNVILIGTISVMYSYLRDLESVYNTVASTYEDITIQKTRIQGVKEIEDLYTNLSKIKRRNFANWKNVNIENLNFQYELDNKVTLKVLNGFNFKFSNGEKVAIIGESGSGKSTLLKVVHGMYENVFADVEVDTKLLKKFELARLDICSTLVPQEPEVFSASIKENLTLLLDFPDLEIKKATDMAMFTEVIENLPKKIDSVVNEKGVNLSGGQKQRLALARALLFSKDKKLILLDESTSSVDPINEVKIYQNIFENFTKATILASIHKMNLLKYFDRIIIMKDGKVDDSGTFEDLLSRNINFKNSWEEYIKNENNSYNLLDKTSKVEAT